MRFVCAITAPCLRAILSSRLFFLPSFTLFTLLLSVPLRAQFGAGKYVYSAGSEDIPEGVLAADFDGDGDVDVMTKLMFGGPVFWIYNDGTGKFSGKNNLPGSDLGTVTCLKAIDYDKDGDNDVVASFDDTKKCMLWQNTGNGVFSSPVTLASNREYIISLYIIDYDKDGDDDIAVATKYEQPFWMENNRPGNTWIKHDFTLEKAGADFFEIVDVNNDGNWDIFTLLDNSTSGLFLNGKSFYQGKSIRRSALLKAVDIDRDGDLDVVAAVEDYEDGVAWLENDNGKFTFRHIPESEGRDYRAGTIFDYDNDGDEDIFMACWFDCGTDLYENLGAGQFKRIASVSGGAVVEKELTHADVDRDGRIDLVQNSGSLHAIYWKPNSKEQFQGIESGFVVGNACTGGDVNFRHAARGKNITKWEWNFGDGSPTVNARNVVHQFTQDGIYQVKLTVTNNLGASATSEQSVQVRSLPKPDDILVRYCSLDTLVTLPSQPNVTYQWYRTLETSDKPYATGNTQRFSDWNFKVYFAAVSDKGCVSPRATVTLQKYSGAMSPTTYSAASYAGPATLTLKAEVPVNHAAETFVWKDETGKIVFTGKEFTKKFDKTTTYFVQTLRFPTCLSPARAITASILSAPIPPPSFTWGDATQSTAGTRAVGFAGDNQGNVVSLLRWASGDAKAGNFTLPISNQSFDYAVIKYDPTGKVLDARKIIAGNKYNSYSESFVIDKSNNYYVAVEMRDDDFEFAGTHISLPNWSETFTFIGKMSSDGKYLWHKIVAGHTPKIVLQSNAVILMNNQGTTRYLTSNGSLASQISSIGYSTRNIAVDSKDNILIAGIPTGNFPYVYNVDYYTWTGSSWTKRLITNDTQTSYNGAAFDSEDNIILTGNVEGAPKHPYAMFGSIPLADGNYFIAKVDKAGNALWAKSFDEGRTAAIATDKDNNIFVAWEIALGISNNIPEPRNGYYLSKYDKNGILQWTKRLSNAALVITKITGVVPDQSGNASVSGSFNYSLDLDLVSLRSEWYENIFTAKLGPASKIDFTYQNGCAGQSTAFSDWSQTGDGSTIKNWQWTFGDGQTSTMQHPTIVYNTAGTYPVTLETTSSLGDKRSITKDVSIINGAATPALTLTPSQGVACQQDLITYQAAPGLASNPIYDWYFNGQHQQSLTGLSSVSIRATQELEVKVKLRLGDACMDAVSLEKSVTVTYNNALRPTRPTITATFALCEGEDVTLSAEQSHPVYLWSNGETTATTVVNESGAYTVKAGADQSCLSESSLPVDVSLATLPFAAIQVDGDRLIASAGARYEWTLNDEPLANTSQAITVEAPGVYRAQVFNSVGCSTWSDPVTVTSIEQGITSDISVTPNPVSEKLAIHSTTPVQKVVVLDAHGRVVYRSNAEKEIQVTKFSSGLYTLVIYSSGQIATRRVMVSH